jgi:2'-5' RNA ligase
MIKNVLKDFGFIPDKNFHPHITSGKSKGQNKIEWTYRTLKH